MIRARQSILLVTCAVALVSGPSAAQVPADVLIPGDRVRYELTEQHAEVVAVGKGYFQALSPGAVSLTVDGSRSSVDIPRDKIAELDVARGRSDFKWPAAIILGTASCLVSANALDSGDDSDDDNAWLIGCPLGFVFGGVFGAFLGDRISWPRWERVEF